MTVDVERPREFAVDVAFDGGTQSEVYESLAAPVVEEALSGGWGTVLAYGQTGTGPSLFLLVEMMSPGKSYSMGLLDRVSATAQEDEGIVPRALRRIFQSDYQVTMSFYQIYREQIHDLLAPPPASRRKRDALSFGWEPTTKNGDLQVREHPVSGFYVEGLRSYVVQNVTEALALVDCGLEHRTLAPTLLNATSSRSHTILSVNVDDSKILFVDLAGSERIRRTMSKGQRLLEARAINSSLAALGNVIAALAANDSHVPYRDSKLTRLLQAPLSGPTALCATVGPAPSSISETISTLAFASRCAHVVRTSPPPSRRQTIDYAAECERMRRYIAELEKKQLIFPVHDVLNKTNDDSDKSEEDLVRRLARASRRALAATAAVDAALTGGKPPVPASSSDDLRSTTLTMERVVETLETKLGPRLQKTLADRDQREHDLKADLESWTKVLEDLVKSNKDLKHKLVHAASLYPADSRLRPRPWRDRHAVHDETRSAIIEEAVSQLDDDDDDDDGSSPVFSHLDDVDPYLQDDDDDTYSQLDEQVPRRRRSTTVLMAQSRALLTDLSLSPRRSSSISLH